MGYHLILFLLRTNDSSIFTWALMRDHLYFFIDPDNLSMTVLPLLFLDPEHQLEIMFTFLLILRIMYENCSMAYPLSSVRAMMLYRLYISWYGD